MRRRRHKHVSHHPNTTITETLKAFTVSGFIVAVIMHAYIYFLFQIT